MLRTCKNVNDKNAVKNFSFIIFIPDFLKIKSWNEYERIFPNEKKYG